MVVFAQFITFYLLSVAVLSTPPYNILKRALKPSPNILPFKDHPDEAKQYAKEVCLRFYNYLSAESKAEEENSVKAFEAVWGEPNDFWNEKVVSKDWDKPAVTKWDENRHILLVGRTLATLVTPPNAVPCDFIDFQVGPDWFKYETTRYLTLSEMLMSPTATITSSTYHFDKKDRTVIRYIVNSKEGAGRQGLRHMIDVALGASTTIQDLAAYLRLIDYEIENENANLIMLKQIFYIILIVVALLFAVIIGICVKYVLNKTVNHNYK